jgi:hypothetical protein
MKNPKLFHWGSMGTDITLRDLAAIAVMQGMVGCNVRAGRAADTAEWAVIYADALLAELEKGSPSVNAASSSKEEK